MTAREIHGRFRVFPGSEQIASEYALDGVMRWIAKRGPRTIVEVGAGIGCLSAAIADAVGPDTVIVAVEPDEWCRTQWQRHVRPRRRTVLAPEFGNRRCEFLVVDGGDARDEYYANLAGRAVVFFEGRRREQRRVLEAMWRGGRPYCRAEWKPSDRSKGFSVYQFEPMAWERGWFALVRLREAARDAIARLVGRPIGKRRPAGTEMHERSVYAATSH